MVVSLEDLDCLDLVIWLRTGAGAASRLDVSQPTISRAIRRVSDLLGVSIVKVAGEWEVRGDQTLLNLERAVHQRYRWIRDLPLRMEAQYYSGPLFCEPAPAGWVIGNFDYLEIHTPLRHLRSGVIDAWIGCYPDVPAPDDPEFVCFHLTRLPVYLVVRADHPLLALGAAITLEDVKRYPSLALADGAFPRVQARLQDLGLWNLQQRMNRYSRQRWEGRVDADLVVGYASAFTLHLFAAPQVILPVPLGLEVGDSLVVRREYAEHPRLLAVLADLALKASELARCHPDVTLPHDGSCWPS